MLEIQLILAEVQKTFIGSCIEKFNISAGLDLAGLKFCIMVSRLSFSSPWAVLFSGLAWLCVDSSLAVATGWLLSLLLHFTRLAIQAKREQLSSCSFIKSQSWYVSAQTGLAFITWGWGKDATHKVKPQCYYYMGLSILSRQNNRSPLYVCL